MKNNCLLLTFCFLLSAYSYTQAQRCGTSQYYELRKQNNPGLQVKMDHAEQITQEWIRRQEPVKNPSLPGFTPTGNYRMDIPAYKQAKTEFLKMHPVASNTSTPASANVEKLRVEKRKNNQIKSMKGGAQ